MSKLMDALGNPEPVFVTFTKVDGGLRTMKCTLSPNLIPQDKLPNQHEDTKPKEETNIIPVFDLEKGEWRSFRKESVICFEVRREL